MPNDTEPVRTRGIRVQRFVKQHKQWFLQHKNADKQAVCLNKSYEPIFHRCLIVYLNIRRKNKSFYSISHQY